MAVVDPVFVVVVVVAIVVVVFGLAVVPKIGGSVSPGAKVYPSEGFTMSLAMHCHAMHCIKHNAA